MRINQVAAQLYTVREFMKTSDDQRRTFDWLRNIGYEAIQLSAAGSTPPERIAQMCAEAGLRCCSTHETGPHHMIDEPEAALDYLQKLECPSLALPGPWGTRFNTRDDVIAFARRLEAAGKVYADAGVTFAYHNHEIEFRRFDGRLMLEVIFDETNPRYVQGEPDTYWIQYGGGDSVEWCRRLRGRLPLLHLKDYKITQDNKPAFAEIGQGNLNWNEIIAAAEASGCEWYIVEQDRCEGDAFEALKTSFEYIRDHLCS